MWQGCHFLNRHVFHMYRDFEMLYIQTNKSQFGDYYIRGQCPVLDHSWPDLAIKLVIHFLPSCIVFVVNRGILDAIGQFGIYWMILNFIGYWPVIQVFLLALKWFCFYKDFDGLLLLYISVLDALLFCKKRNLARNRWMQGVREIRFLIAIKY